ncbi:MAG: glycoside hydrolase [Spirochaetaceae bacterium]|jgi:hypothetical protein|nr:glycoside hydrolase [Spirochaetaceae bacterium]
MKGRLKTGLVVLAALFVSCQTTRGGSNAETTQAVFDTYGFKPIPDSGVYWTAVEDSPFHGGGSNDRITAIVYGGGRFVAVGLYEDGSNWEGEMAYSADGVIWTKVKDNKLGYAEAFAYGGGKFVAGSKGGKIAYSTDGVTWTAVEDSTFSNQDNITRLFYGGGTFFAYSGYPAGKKDKTAYSTDGVTWTAVKDSAFGGSDSIHTITYGGGRFVAGGGYNDRGVWRGKMAYSDDGVTWSRVDDNEFIRSALIETLAYGGGKFVAGNNGRVGQFAYSDDGTTWTAVEGAFGNGISVIVYDGSRFVAACWNGTVALSADGVTWTTGENINLGGSVRDIAYGGGRFVAVGNQGKIAYFNMQE